MILYLCVLIMVLFHRESLKLILAMNPSSRWFCHICVHHVVEDDVVARWWRNPVAKSAIGIGPA
jgi:hypothetical protein